MAEIDPQADREQRLVADTRGCGPRSGGTPQSSPPESRELDEKLLDEGQLRLHFSQLEHVSDRIEVSVKRSAEALPEPAQLQELILPLVQRRVFGAQVQHRSQGQSWLDTFVATRGGVRMVRLRLTG